jgi:protein-L-isoaspartate(D-aspartate) O-methyltransferase
MNMANKIITFAPAMIDNYKHKGMRKQLVATIKDKGISSNKILNAIEKIPRHFFLDSSFEQFAYKDEAFPIGSGQTISQPYTVAFQTQLLEIKKRDKVLEIGTGSGYQACVLAELGAKVFSIERQKKLHNKTKIFLNDLGYNIKTFYGDGFLGLPAFQPFDKIIITAGAPEIPETLKNQLKIGGIMVVPYGDSKQQRMIRVKRISDSEFEEKDFGAFLFVPMLKDKADD